MKSSTKKSEHQEVLDAISGLAQATGKGFEDVRRRFISVHNQLDKLHYQINQCFFLKES